MGEPADFEDWYRIHHPRLLAAMVVLSGDIDVAADVAAEAFARTLERWERVAAMANPAGWTYQVGVNLLRRRWRRRVLEGRALRRAAPVPPMIADVSAERVDVWRAVCALPRRARTAVVLRYYASMTEDEVAAAMGVAPGTVAATLSNARRRLAPVLADLSSPEGLPHV